MDDGGKGPLGGKGQDFRCALCPLALCPLSWPTALVGWVLEATIDPSDPQSWEPITTQPVTADQVFQVSLPTEDGQRFFRLQQR